MLKKKIVLITGVGKGIGLSCLELCIKKGAYVIGVTRSKSDYERLNKIYKNKCKIILGDITDKKTFKKIINFKNKNNFFINSLINNAGIRFRKKFLDIDLKEYKRVFDHNFFSVVELCKLVIGQNLRSNKKISIVNLSSIVGSRGFDELSAYGSSKGALDAFTKCLAIEFARNIRINNIRVGGVQNNQPKEFIKNFLKKTPNKKLVNKNDLAYLVDFLCSEKSNNIIGENINLEGGYNLW